MNLTNQILPSEENLADFMKNYPADTPVVMVNILKFKDKSEDGRSGEKVYNNYMKETAQILEKVGGKLIWCGNTFKTLAGDADNEPDRFLIVWYPNKEAFFELGNAEEYKAIAHLRNISVQYGGLIATETMSFGSK